MYNSRAADAGYSIALFNSETNTYANNIAILSSVAKNAGIAMLNSTAGGSQGNGSNSIALLR